MRVLLEPVRVPEELRDDEVLALALEVGKRRAFVAIAEDAVNRILYAIHETKPFPPINTGMLARRGSWDYRIEEDGSGLEVGATPAILARAFAMDQGRKPGKWPPLAPLRRWVHLKGLARSPGEELAIAKSIRRKIAVRGLDPRRFMAAARPGVELSGRDLLHAYTLEALREALAGGGEAS